MRCCLYQEVYKISHKKITYLAPLLILVTMAIVKVAVGSEEAQLLAMTNYAAGQGILLVLVVVGSTIFSMEYQNNAILTVLYKTPNKFFVYLAKFIVMLGYDLFLHIIAILTTFLFQLTPLAINVNWFSIYQYNDTLLMNMVKCNLVDGVTSVLIISLIFLTSCLINSNAVVVTLNSMIIFMGQFVSASLLNDRVAFSKVLKWNPLNMINLSQQYYNYDVYHDTTMLTNPQILYGTISYIFIFLLIGYLIFRKKRF